MLKCRRSKEKVVRKINTEVQIPKQSTKAYVTFHLWSIFGLNYPRRPRKAQRDSTTLGNMTHTECLRLMIMKTCAQKVLSTEVVSSTAFSMLNRWPVNYNTFPQLHTWLRTALSIIIDRCRCVRLPHPRPHTPVAQTRSGFRSSHVELTPAVTCVLKTLHITASAWRVL